ncbi:MAG: class I SAM-dependent methyltransferase [Oscillospiraceae bacterium]
MNLIHEMKDFFDKLAPYWGPNSGESNERDKIIELADIKPNSVIADIGCGKGVMIPHLLSTDPHEIIGVDVSTEMIRFAELEWLDLRVSFIAGDILKTELPPLDVAMIYNAYPHFLDKTALSEKLFSSLNENGTVIIAHSRSKEKINGIHKEGIATCLSIKLKTPLEEYESFKEQFTLELYEDSEKLYFIKLKKKHN